MNASLRARASGGFAAAALLLIATACSGSSEQSFEPVPTNTLPPTATATQPPIVEPTPTIPVGLLEFYDFSELPSNFAQGDFVVDGHKRGTTGLLSEQYRITVSGSNTYIYSASELVLGDVRVESDMSKISGSPDDGWGLFCRFTDKDHFYAFTIFSDGRYSIDKVRGDQWLPLGAPEPVFSNELQQGGAINHLRIDCNDDVLTLEANGQLVGAARDSEYKTGQVGMFASVFEGMGIDVLFDYLAIFQP